MVFAEADGPLDVTLLIFPGFSLLSLAATLDPLRGANRVLARGAYRWRLVTMDGKPATASCGLELAVDGAFDPEDVGALLIVVAAFGADRQSVPPTLRAIRKAARRAQTVIGVEAGAWVLARAGLLDGRRATTHWEDLEEFAAAFAHVEVVPDRFVGDGPCYTTGGATPALDLMLTLIRARHGYSAALDVASLYIYEEMRTGADTQPVVSLGRIRHHEPRVAEAIRIMEASLDTALTMAALARRLGLSARSLEVLFRRTVGASPGAYFLKLRLGAARRLVLDTNLSMAEIAARSGFSSISALSRAFRRAYGEAPSMARRKRS
ncbi:GlxA family transcriptional regulator [Aureimonas frigidaquae]|nr:GlxA family transcriptional regulator [Aureimonas frigidaquae]